MTRDSRDRPKYDTAMIDRINSVAVAWRVQLSAVHFEFRAYHEGDGGPGWTVCVSLPLKDKRSPRSIKSFYAPYLEDVCADAIIEAHNFWSHEKWK